MLFYTGSHINTRGFNGRMSQYVCQMGHILLRRIKTPGKQVSEIMRKYLILFYSCLCAKLFHGMADIASVNNATCVVFPRGNAGIDRSLQVHFIMGNQHLLYIPPVGPHIVRPPLYFEWRGEIYKAKAHRPLQIDVRHITKFIMHKQGKVAAGWRASRPTGQFLCLQRIINILHALPMQFSCYIFRGTLSLPALFPSRMFHVEHSGGIFCVFGG